MHSFCCVSTVSDNSPSNRSPYPMPDLHISPASPALSLASRSDPTIRISHHRSLSNCDAGRLSQRSIFAAEIVGRHSSAREPPVDVKINDIVGNGICGILYKWVNYGKGWRPRWFVLQDGVLTYYKIHGPDKIVVRRDPRSSARCRCEGFPSIRTGCLITPTPPTQAQAIWGSSSQGLTKSNCSLIISASKYHAIHFSSPPDSNSHALFWSC